MARSPDPSKWVAFAIEHGPELRAAGVSRIEFDGCSIEFSAPALPAPTAEELAELQRDPEPAISDPLDDPHTFGLRGRVPRFVRNAGGDS